MKTNNRISGIQKLINDFTCFFVYRREIDENFLPYKTKIDFFEKRKYFFLVLFKELHHGFFLAQIERARIKQILTYSSHLKYSKLTKKTVHSFDLKQFKGIELNFSTSNNVIYLITY